MPFSAETRLDTSFNEYYRIGGTSQSHDDHGNLTNDGAFGQEWDAMNRLREVNDTTGTVVRYLYDATNRRVMKDFPTTSTHVDTEYTYDGWQAVEEYEDGDGDPARQFVIGRYIDEPLRPSSPLPGPNRA